MAKNELSVSTYKILETLKCLNDQGYYALASGISKILTGVKDEETIRFANFRTFATLATFNPRKTGRAMNKLFIRGYINKIYNAELEIDYYAISMDGLFILNQYLKTHKKPYAKTTVKFKPSIIKTNNKGF